MPPDLGPDFSQLVGHVLNILVTSPTQTQYDILTFPELFGQLNDTPDGMRALQCGDNPFQLTEKTKSFKGILISGGNELYTAAVFPVQ